jgi:hypothetical protein
MEFDHSLYKCKPPNRVEYVYRNGNKVAVTVENPRTKRPQRLFAPVPEEWIKVLSGMPASTWQVAVIIHWRAFRQKSVTTKAADWSQYGVSRKKRHRELRRLEGAGLVSVSWGRGNESPTVTILEFA